MTSARTGRRAGWLSAALALALATTAIACTSAPPAQQPTDSPAQQTPPAGATEPQPDDPVTGAPGMPPGGPAPDGALRVEPEPGIVDPRPHAWERIEVAPDGRTLTVYYWGGVQDCYGLAGVEVERDDDGLLHVTVFEGRRGDLPPDTACIEIALLKSVVVELDEPLVASPQ